MCPATRFADFALDAPRQRLIAVAEIHPRRRGAAPRPPPQRARIYRPLRQGRADRRAGHRPRLLCQPALVAGRRAAGLPCLGPARHAVGQCHPLCGHRRRGRQAGAAQENCRAETAAPSSSRIGARTGTSISSGTRPAGASSIAGRTARSCAYTARAVRSWRGRSGSSAHAAMRCTPTARSAWCRCRAGTPLFEVRDLKGGKVTRYRAAAETDCAHRRSCGLRPPALPP